MNKIAKLIVLILFSTPVLAGGKYIGKVRPYYYNGSLYLDPVGVEKSNIPACATRKLLRLQEGDQESAVFKNKFSILLASWMADKNVELQGKGECTSEGDEVIFVVIPK